MNCTEMVFIFVCCVCKGVSSSKATQRPIVGLLKNDELQMMWKEVASYLQVLSRHSLAGPEENQLVLQPRFEPGTPPPPTRILVQVRSSTL
jgi:hypothetical protein